MGTSGTVVDLNSNTGSYSYYCHFACPQGFYNPTLVVGGSSSDCEGPCPAGKYSNLGSTTCYECAAGKFSSSPGSPSCSSCLSGKFAPSRAATSESACSPCPAGSYSGPASPSCAPCAKGKFSGSGGKGACADCAAGKYADREGGEVCAPCRRGSYANNTASASCVECANTFTTLRDGQKSPSMCIKSPVWMAAFVGPCYITVLFLYIFGRDIFLFILPSRVAKKTKALPFEVPGSAKTLLRVTVGGLLGFATSILVLWELSTDSPHAAIHTVGAFIGAVLAWSDLMEYLFLNVSKILLILDLASDFYVVYANQISGNPDIVRLLLFLIVGPYFILAASIAPMYPTIFDLAEGRSLAITTHGQPIVFMTLKRDTFPRRLALCFYTPSSSPSRTPPCWPSSRTGSRCCSRRRGWGRGWRGHLQGETTRRMRSKTTWRSRPSR